MERSEPVARVAWGGAEPPEVRKPVANLSGKLLRAWPVGHVGEELQNLDQGMRVLVEPGLKPGPGPVGLQQAGRNPRLPG